MLTAGTIVVPGSGRFFVVHSYSSTRTEVHILDLESSGVLAAAPYSQEFSSW